MKDDSDTTYTKLADLRPHTDKVNVFGVVKSFRPPAKSRGTDYYLSSSYISTWGRWLWLSGAAANTIAGVIRDSYHYKSNVPYFTMLLEPDKFHYAVPLHCSTTLPSTDMATRTDPSVTGQPVLYCVPTCRSCELQLLRTEVCRLPLFIVTRKLRTQN